jgi:hypothetical protein
MTEPVNTSEHIVLNDHFMNLRDLRWWDLLTPKEQEAAAPNRYVPYKEVVEKNKEIAEKDKNIGELRAKIRELEVILTVVDKIIFNDRKVLRDVF